MVDGVTDVEMGSPEAATRMRPLMETLDCGDDALAEQYWRADDCVAKVSMDDLTGSSLVDENGETTRILQRTAGRSAAWVEVAHWTSKPRWRPRRNGGGHET